MTDNEQVSRSDDKQVRQYELQSTDEKCYQRTPGRDLEIEIRTADFRYSLTCKDKWSLHGLRAASWSQIKSVVNKTQSKLTDNSLRKRVVSFWFCATKHISDTNFRPYLLITFQGTRASFHLNVLNENRRVYDAGRLHPVQWLYSDGCRRVTSPTRDELFFFGGGSFEKFTRKSVHF